MAISSGLIAPGSCLKIRCYPESGDKIAAQSRITRVPGIVGDHSFQIHSNATKAALRMLSDANLSLLGRTVKLYGICDDRYVVTTGTFVLVESSFAGDSFLTAK